MAKLTNGTLLSAGTHKMKIEIIIIRDDDNKLADCVLPFTVDPAPLTPSITGTAAKTYEAQLPSLLACPLHWRARWATMM